jgi:hypothetical protein
MYRVQTRDVDGSDTRVYKTLAGAIKRFEEMCGHTVKDAICEQYHWTSTPPTVDEAVKKGLRAVSNFGAVVYLELAP